MKKLAACLRIFISIPMDQSSVLQVVDVDSASAVLPVVTVREIVPNDVLAQSVTELSSPKDQGAKGSELV